MWELEQLPDWRGGSRENMNMKNCDMEGGLYFRSHFSINSDKDTLK